MPLPFIFTALLALQAGQDPGQEPGQRPAQVAPLTPDFSAAPSVADSMRMALTPKLDGMLEPEEWDPLTSSPTLKSYFQWEPGMLHVAGTVADGNDLLVSLDLKGNGWLVGKDNVEVRVSFHGGTPQLVARLLDATRVDGPHWVDVPAITAASKVAAKSEGGNTTYEVSISDAGYGLIPDEGGKMAVRVDGVGTAAPTVEPFTPRVLAPATLTLARAAALPSGLHWDVDGQGSFAAPGEPIKLRFKFTGNEKLGLQRFAMRSEGLARAATSDGSVPFPAFDKKGRTFVDYSTTLSRNAEPGYRIAQGAVTAADGVPGVIEASYRVAPPLEVRVSGAQVRSKSTAQTVQLAYEVISNSSTTRRIDGNVRVTIPQGYHIVEGDNRDFSLYGPKGKVRRVFRIDLPAGTTGVIPITIRLESRGEVINQVQYVSVQ